LQALVRRYAIRDREAILCIVNSEGLLAAYLDHVQRWETVPDPLFHVMIRQALSGMVLYLSCRPKDESVAWTLNFRKPPANVFVAGEGDPSTVTGRVYTEGVKTSESSRLFVETRRPKRGTSQSVVDVAGYDVLEILEAYYQQSEQHPARFLELNDHEYAMVNALPGVDREWLFALTATGVHEALLAEPRQIDERAFVFQCGCTLERITAVVRGAFKENPDELFQGESGVETFCPRCGHRWWVSRELFEREPG
jgi:molecular chaperone Hsp33